MTHDFTLASAGKALRGKAVSARELTDAHLDAIARLNPDLNALITVTEDAARSQADAADARLAAGDDSPLLGIPLALKDLYCTAGVRTTAGSRMLEHFVPTYESTVSAKLRDAGAVMVGKANLDEFAMGSSNLSSAFGPAKSPWSRDDGAAVVPGGSSGGSAAAVAAGLALGATGTDTGGSIRQPASYCGIAGIKPTYGRCSRYGVIAFASSLDQPGAFGRTVEDCAILLGAMAGFDPRDSTSADEAVPDFRAACARGVKGLRIGIPREYRVDGMPAEIEALWRQGEAWLRDAGATVVDVSLPHTKYGLATYYIVAPAEASSNLARYDGVRFGLRVPGADLTELYENTRAAGFGAEVRRRVLIGTYVLSSGYYDAYYLRAQKVRALILRDFTEAFRDVDALLTPTAPSAAFAVDETPSDPVTMYLNDVFTVPASLAGIPGHVGPGGPRARACRSGCKCSGGRSTRRACSRWRPPSNARQGSTPDRECTHELHAARTRGPLGGRRGA